MAKTPWASGPGEILQHGLSLLSEDSDAHRRLAMLSIDNSVELMIKTYLGLPKRVSGLVISRKEYAEFSESFPALLDALERHANDKIVGIDLGEIEWYHRLRNQLYHQGNGLTVEIEKVRVYAELAKLLFRNLFGTELEVEERPHNRIVGDFLASWAEMESCIRALWSPDASAKHKEMPYHFVGHVQDLAKNGIIDSDAVAEISALRNIRNRVVHGAADISKELRPELIKRVAVLTTMLRKKLDSPRSESA